ncbi:hypothetical protein NADE_005036 [Nannochloris sp. 'desiccata']|nr:hypothetical protein KSW81_006504 [Chlorella desiccata (nom. nud.)]KAH7622451.1 hypothetical protein NADE_005036 [Chlorella desiccata (nom. nud.)]
MASPNLAYGLHTKPEFFLLSNQSSRVFPDPLSSSPSGDVCDACTASIVRTFKSLIPKFNVPCDAASTATQYTETALIVLLTTCPNQIFSTLEGAGFSIQKLANLESCPDGPYAQQIDAAKEICPNLPAGNQENGLRK